MKALEILKEEILINLENPKHLELLYQKDKTVFKHAFLEIYPMKKEILLVQAWNERLRFQKENISLGSKTDWIVVLILASFAGLVAKFPQFISVDEELFYSRNIGFIVFPFLSAFFAWKQQMELKKLLIISSIYLLSAIYINLLPNDLNDSLVLACIHLPFLLWALVGVSFSSGKLKDLHKRLEFLRFNGDFIVMTTVLLIGGAILSGITLGLFEFINLHIEEFYFQNIAIWGLAAIPAISTFLVRTNPQLVNKVSPIVAKIFTPLVLVMLLVYLFAILGNSKDPFTDRNFLIIFNVLLIGVMALILFSISEFSKNTKSNISTYLLFSLSIVTIIVNSIALSAILFRLTEWGITPNRLAVLGGNVLILANLLIVTYKLLKVIRSKNTPDDVALSISKYLPVYVVWAAVVVFLFPMLF